MHNSNIGGMGGAGGVGESEMDIEFGYCSEEESIFQSFSQDLDRALPKVKRTYSLKEDQKGQKVQVRDMLKRVIPSM